MSRRMAGAGLMHRLARGALGGFGGGAGGAVDFLATELDELILTELGEELLTEQAAPVANAGPDASFDMLGAAPCQLAGSATGVGTIAYLWTKVSGTPTPTFADANNPLTTCTVDAHGALVLDLAAIGPAGTTHDQVTITVNADLTALLARMATGSRVCEWWETGLGQTDSGGLVQTIASQGNNATWAPTQGNAALRPTSSATGGPLADGPCITLPRTTDILTDTVMTVATGKALFFGTVAKGLAAGATRTQVAFRDAVSDIVHLVSDTAANLYQTIAKPTGGSEETAVHTVPAHSTSWYYKTLRYAAAIAPEAKIANASVSPGFLTATGLCADVETHNIGHASLSGGSWYLQHLFEAVTTTAAGACLSEEAAIRYLVNKKTGL